MRKRVHLRISLPTNKQNLILPYISLLSNCNLNFSKDSPKGNLPSCMRITDRAGLTLPKALNCPEPVPASIHICGESGLRFIPHYSCARDSFAAETRSHPRDFLPADFSPGLSAGPLRGFFIAVHRAQLFVDLQLAPKHVITRFAVSEEIVGSPDRRCRSPRALHFIYASLAAVLPCLYKSDVNGSLAVEHGARSQLLHDLLSQQVTARLKMMKHARTHIVFIHEKCFKILFFY